MKERLYIISNVCPKEYCMRLWYYFRHAPSKGLQLLTRVEYQENKGIKAQFKYSENNGLIQDKHMQCINESNQSLT